MLLSDNNLPHFIAFRAHNINAFSGTFRMCSIHQIIVDGFRSRAFDNLFGTDSRSLWRANVDSHRPSVVVTNLIKVIESVATAQSVHHVEATFLVVSVNNEAVSTVAFGQTAVNNRASCRQLFVKRAEP